MGHYIGSGCLGWVDSVKFLGLLFVFMMMLIVLVVVMMMMGMYKHWHMTVV